MSYKRYLYCPYVPNRSNKKKSGRPTPYAYLHRIAYTEVMRGMNDEIPTLMFYAPFELLKDACGHLFKLMNGRVGNLIIKNSHSCRVRNGRCYWRIEVHIVNLDEAFMSLSDFTMLLIARMKNICNCTIRHYRLETFLNL